MNIHYNKELFHAVAFYDTCEVWTNFKLYEIGWCGDDTPIFMDKNNNEVSIEKADFEVTGRIKWDGCTDLTFQEDIHFCGLESWENLNKAMKWVYELSVNEIPNANKELILE